MYKNILFAILGIILLVGGFFGLQKYQQIQADKKYYVNRSYLTSAQRDQYHQKISADEAKLAIATKPDDRYNLYMDEGFQYYGLGELLVAKSLFLKAEALHPEQSSVYAALYQVELEAGNFKLAEEAIKKATDIYQSNPDYWQTYIGFEQNQMKASVEAVKALYAKALEKTQGASEILVSYAQYLESLGDLVGALETMKAALAVQPNQSSLYQPEIDRLEKLIKK